MNRINIDILIRLLITILIPLCLIPGCIKDPVSRNIGRLQYRNDKIRREAAEALGESNDPRAIKPLITTLGDSTSDVRNVAEQALIKLCTSEKELSSITLADCNWRLFDLTLRPFITRSAFIDGLVAETAITELLTTLRTNPELSRSAAMVLARTPNPRMIELLATILKDDARSAVRIVAAEALGEMKDPRAIDLLIAAINDRSEIVRLTAISALGRIGDPRAVASLVALLKHSNPNIRITAATSLGDTDDATAIEPLITALNDSNENVREAVIVTLGKIKDPRSVEPLIACLKDSTPQRLQKAAVGALAQMNEIVIETLLASGPSAVEQLLVLVISSNEDLKENALKALAKMGLEGILRNSIGMKLVFIPPGEFLMGSSAPEEHRDSDEKPQHRVRICKGFLIAQTEVTQAQYQAVMGTNPSHFNNRADLPVENVSWHDAEVFCRRLSEKENRSYRLPTEAEWEYACRAGTTTAFCFGSSLDASMANFNGNYPYGNGRKGPYLQKTVMVKTYQPNAWGLYDMHGNVWEWCSDWYTVDYRIDLSVDSKGTSFGKYRILRGGSWYVSSEFCRSAGRYWSLPVNKGSGLGFRIALDLN